MAYVTGINTPGYMPFDDDPPIFETPAEAWEYLADERERQEDFAFDYAYSCDPGLPDEGYSDTVKELREAALNGTGEGAIYGDTPGYDGDHDLGQAYTVAWLPDNDDTLTLKED